ncbi:bifunctional diguanylate cyclase/phosphodiesterase [Bacillus sp. SJS]|uniref:bifunctional diguanylate cyclase/phosphodiesterase n=1 Tax=Bacillus sp. SJS TaxID=1423321 RepID=UPI0004DCB7C8|nr:bifunctional diguanylate cyclase/phosphodiesterase [Bacillus sp. SJS]
MEHASIMYNIPLVILSVIIAVTASFAALNVSIKINKAKPLARYIWLASGAFAMGLGIWAMHFVAMLALHLSMPVSYDYQIVVISIIPAIIASGLALYVISRKTAAGTIRITVSALLMAIGIVSMHYTGMAAMKMAATIQYDPIIWGLSAIIAFITSVVALYLLQFVSQNHRKPGIWRIKAGSALIMGIAIAGMHYTGMAAAKFTPHSHHIMSKEAAIDNTLLAYSIAFCMLVIFGIVFISMFVDQRFEHQSIQSERKFRSVFESANDAIILADSRGVIISWNQGAERMFGYKELEVTGQKLQMIIPDKFKEAHQRGMDRYLSTKEERVVGQTVELEGLNKNGNEFPIELSLASWKEDQEIYFSSIIRDITERKKTEMKINQMVYRDALTDLPNRLLLNDRLSSAMDQAAANQQQIGIMFMDLDRFKNINDTLGHDAGDQLLIEVAKRIKASLDKSDTVSRQGGDEFIILLPHTSTAEVTKKAQTVIDLFSRSITIKDIELFVTPSIGIAMYPADGRDIDSLVKNADTAMYRVKEDGKNNFQFYAPSMNEIVSKKMQLENGMRKALKQNEFRVVYQPQVEVATGKIIGVEALLRWHHPEWGVISPAEFIPIAEETGLILPIGEWVLHEACLQNKTWQQNGYQPLRMAVNISSRQFQQSNLVEMVRDTLTKTGLHPSFLELELTESIIQDSNHAVHKMQQLRDMGIHLSIDDFGTGYSSLSYLKTFPINTLKIDQTFTRNIYTDPKDASLVDTIINMAHNLNLKVIAEGVETEEQLQFLETKNCNEAQGYYFSRPISAEDLEVILGEEVA